MKKIIYSAIAFVLLSGTAMCQDTIKQVYEGSPGPKSTRTDAYTYVEVMPKFNGGQENYNNYLATSLKYPKEAMEADISGTVYVRFVINADGKVSDVEILRGIGHGCDKEAKRVIEHMPDWIPGKQNGKNVSVFMTLPIKFKMK
jgi:protein TonB